jgi:RNA polymerase sigma-70 factor, ECF subfamily
MPEMPSHAVMSPPRSSHALPSARIAAVPGREDAVQTRRPDRAERRLVARLRAGDPDALAGVYDRCGAATFGFLVRLIGDRAAAEDGQQQVFTEVWRRGAEYDPARAGLLTWVMTIARSRGIDHLRRRVPEPTDPHGPLAQAEADRTAPLEADRLLDRWRMAAHLQRIPPEERHVLRLRFYDGLTQAEIAEATGIALGTIKTRMVRGLSRLRDLLEAEEGAAA